MRHAAVLLVVLLLAAPPQGRAQHPLRHFVDGMELRFARTQPVVSYTLTVDSADLSAFAVEMRIRNAPDTFRLALAVHPEYDDRFFRFVEGLTVTARAGPTTVTREDSTLWRVTAPAGESVVRYRIRLPAPEPGPRAGWRPFLTPTGGLLGGPHAFMYLAGAELAPAHIAVALPASWETATGLPPTGDPHTFFAPSANVLMDSPLLVGRLRTWRFAVDGVPHHVVYWPLPPPMATPFDSAALVKAIEALVREAVALFGRAPYREYLFLLQDGAYGALEHWNSVTLGVPSADLARDSRDALMELAHEYFHTWNLMRIRPREYRGVHHRPPERTRGLWWSEGITIYYADLLLRRAGVPVRDSTRRARLENAIARYLSRPGNARFAPESVSVVTYGSGGPGALGDYDASVHLQGELLGTMLDLIVRDATGGHRSLDDVLRLMLEQFSGERGFDGGDVERTVADVCGCVVRPFFDRYVRSGNPIDFDRYLGLAGLRARITWTPALDRDGRPAPDTRIFARVPLSEAGLRLVISSPETVWSRAGLHTGDRLVAINGTRPASWPEFREVLSRLRIGDTVRVEVLRASGGRPARSTVIVTGYDRPVVRIEDVPEAGPAQRALRERWLAAR